MGRWRMAMLSMPVSMSVPVPLVLVLVESAVRRERAVRTAARVAGRGC